MGKKPPRAAFRATWRASSSTSRISSGVSRSCVVGPVFIASFLHRAEGETGDDMLLDQAEENERRHKRQGSCRRHLSPIGAGHGDELGEASRDRASVDTG